MVIIFIFFGLACLSSYLLCYLFIKVSKKKEEFLSIFYENDPNFVGCALDRAENFNQKIGLIMDNTIDNKSDLNQHSLSKTTNYYNNIESSEELSFIGATQQITNQITTISDNNGHIRHHSIKSNRFLGTQIFIILSMLISTFFSIIIYIVLSTNFTTIEGEIKVYLATSEYNNKIIMIFNIFREYMFDKILFVKYIDLQAFLQDELKNFYTQAIESNKIVAQY